MQLRLNSPWLWVALVSAWLLLWVTNWGAIVGFLFLAILGGWLVLARHIRRVRAWERLAHETGGEFVDGELWADAVAFWGALSPSAWKAWALLTSPWRSNAVQWRLDTGPMTLDTDSYPEEEGDMPPEAKYTRLRAAFPNPHRFRFQLYAAEVGPQPGPVMQTAMFGDTDLDRRFSLRTNDVAKAQELFASPQLRALLRAESLIGLRLENRARTSYLAYDQEGVIVDLQRLEALHALFIATLGRLSTIVSTAVADDVGATTAPGSVRGVGRAAPLSHAGVAPPEPLVEPAPAVVRADSSHRTPPEPQPEPRSLERGVTAEPPQQTEIELGDALERVLESKAADPAQANHGDEQAALPTVGETASNERWELELKAFGPYEQLVGQPPPSGSPGRLVVAEFVAKNLQRFTGSFTTSNFSLEDGTGGVVQPAGQTASVPKGFWLVWVQSNQSAEHRVVFELAADAAQLTLNLLGVRFRIPG